MMESKALYFTQPYQVEVRKQALPEPQSGQALVQAAVSAISSGTEMLFYRGQVPTDMAVDSSIPNMQGAVTYPLPYGYALVGRVIALGAGVERSWLGKQVFLFHPHESQFVSAVSNLHLVPEGMAAETAVFLPFMETAVSFLMDGRPVIGEKVALFGQGIVGLLTTALLSQYPLADLISFDNFPLRRRWSRQLGARAAVDPGVQPNREKLVSLFANNLPYSGADLVYELTGNPQALNLAVQAAGYAGRVIVGSWYGQKQAPLDLGSHFHRNHLRLISSQVSSIAPNWRGRFDHSRRLQVAWSMLAQHRPEKLISHRFALEQAGEAYKLLDKSPQEVLQILFTYSEGD